MSITTTDRLDQARGVPCGEADRAGGHRDRDGVVLGQVCQGQALLVDPDPRLVADVAVARGQHDVLLGPAAVTEAVEPGAALPSQCRPSRDASRARQHGGGLDHALLRSAGDITRHVEASAGAPPTRTASLVLGRASPVVGRTAGAGDHAPERPDGAIHAAMVTGFFGRRLRDPQAPVVRDVRGVRRPCGPRKRLGLAPPRGTSAEAARDVGLGGLLVGDREDLLGGVHLDQLAGLAGGGEVEEAGLL